MGKPQLTQLPNYQNYQNAIKMKTPSISWIPTLLSREKEKAKKKIFLDLKFLFLSPQLLLHFNSDQKTLTFALSFSLSVWFLGNFYFIHFPSLTFRRKFQSLVLLSLSLSKYWMAGMLGSEGRVFFVLDLECLEREQKLTNSKREQKWKQRRETLVVNL